MILLFYVLLNQFSMS